jgi:hypothetical protein
MKVEIQVLKVTEMVEIRANLASEERKENQDKRFADGLVLNQ